MNVMPVYVFAICIYSIVITGELENKMMKISKKTDLLLK